MKVSINVLDKSIHLSDLLLAPADVAVTRIKLAVEEAMKAKGNPVVSWGDDIHFILFGPFAKSNPFEKQQMIREILYNGLEYPDVHVLSPDCRPVLQLGMKPNSEIVIHGVFAVRVTCPSGALFRLLKRTRKRPWTTFTVNSALSSGYVDHAWMFVTKGMMLCLT